MADGAESYETDTPLSDQTAEFTGRYILVFGDDVQNDPGAITEALQSVAEKGAVELAHW